MLKTVKDACQVHPMALDYAMTEQIENLSSIIEKTEKDAIGFFEQNYITKGMETLLSDGLKRLAGKSDQAVFELKQAMGGGKTHSMVALGLLARNPHLRNTFVPEIAQSTSFDEDAIVVAINGRTVSSEHFLWGDIAEQLGKPSDFARFWKDGAKAPTENDWVELIGQKPTLILLDELPPYFGYAITQPVGGATLAQVTTYALSNLLSAAAKLKHCCIVLSNLSGSYEGATRQLHQAITDFKQEANRQARSITPVELASDEIYEILRKRLFKSLPEKSVIDGVAGAYSQALSEAVRAKSIAKSAEQIVDEIHRSYPFHPSIKSVVALFRENEGFRQTRGLMQFISKMIKSVWERSQNDVYLIGCQHLDFNNQDVREEIKRISDLQDAVAHDVASNGSSIAELVDANLSTDAATQLASLLLTASLSEAVEGAKGLTEQEMLEVLVAPNRNASEYQEAFKAFRVDAWYLHRKENQAYYFSKLENLRKRIDSRAKNAPQPKIDKLMKDRLELIFKPEKKIAYQEVYALPVLDEIKLNAGRVCLVLSPDSKMPPQEAQQFWNSVTQKNNFCVVTGDGSSLGNLEEKARRLWAIARVLEETGGDKSVHKSELEEEAEGAEQDFNATVKGLFNRVYFPSKDGLKPAKLAMTFTGNQFRAEEQVEKALADTSASKLYVTLERHEEALLNRAEDMLWRSQERRVPWRDVVSGTVDNPRWPFLPPKGIEKLKETAIGQGRWRDSCDGYIEKGPFPKPKTSVTVTQRNYDDTTGQATLEVLPRDAGQHGRVHYSTQPEVTIQDPVAPEVLETCEIRLYFLAYDPNEEHETGEVKAWSNKLTLTRDVQEIAGKRIVTLSVVPSSAENKPVLRWNTDARNAREGQIYTTPIELTDLNEATVYVHAECQKVEATANFKIPKPQSQGVSLDKTKPATFKKKLNQQSTADSFAAIQATKAVNARITGITVDVGEGAKAVSTRFGTDTEVSGDNLEQFISMARQAISDPTAEVRISFRDIAFQSGHDLEEFMKKLNLEARAEDIEQ